MIKKLRIKFVAAAMLAITLVLVAAMGIITVRGYVQIINRADEIIDILQKNDGKFPVKFAEKEADSGAYEFSADDLPPKLPEGNPEMRFETRFFAVVLSEDGGAFSVDVENVAAIDYKTASEYALSLKSQNKTSGFYGVYRYGEKTIRIANENGEKITLSRYIFVDCTRERETFFTFVKTGALVGGVCLVVVFLLVTLFSKIVFKPVAESYEKQKRFITDANHELKTPLAVIKASCEACEIENGENEWTANIKDQVEKTTELVNSLVFLSRMDEENFSAALTEFSLSEVVEDCLKPYEKAARAQGKNFVSSVNAGVTIKGDVSSIRELVSVLLDNALKYSVGGGNISVTLTGGAAKNAKNAKNAKVAEKNKNEQNVKIAKGARLVVENDCYSVPQGDLSMLFERFYRLDSSRNSETGGHGIGLSVAKAVAERHKAAISAYSPDGKRIIFTVTF